MACVIRHAVSRAQPHMHIVFWGTYDTGKPRTRILRRALSRIDPRLTEIHAEVWDGVEDKSSLTGGGAKVRRALRWLSVYPRLLWRYCRAEKHDVVVVGYFGLLDVIVLAPFARMRGVPVVWDAFLSTYDTLVRDRGMKAETSLSARLVRRAERLAARLADVVVLDTRAHAAMFVRLHDIAPEKTAAVLVGAEGEAFPRIDRKTGGDGRIHVLFYGQFIPLHGIDTIVEAALSERGRAHDWTIIGTGQEAARIDAKLARADAPHIVRRDWVDYPQLAREMEGADICLGIFGTSEKAASVIPNKVFQALSAGMPLVTRASSAMAELASDDAPGVYLVEAGNAQALLDGLERFAAQRESLAAPLHYPLQQRFSEEGVTSQWRAVLEDAVRP